MVALAAHDRMSVWTEPSERDANDETLGNNEAAPMHRHTTRRVCGADHLRTDRPRYLVELVRRGVTP